jgi:hypothetical protein
MGQISHPYDYAVTYRQALKVNWQLDDIIGGEKRLDFRIPFLPDAWVDADALPFLSASERLTVNHIRSHSYLSLFGVVEEYIVPFVVEQIQDRIHRAAQAELQALLHFAEEESKHIELFQRFGAEFRSGFASPCAVIGPPAAVAAQILKKSPLGVALSILQIEWMTQLHYVASVKDNHDLDAQFCSLLRHHWLEEAQHAKLDTLLVAALAQQLSATEIEAGIDDYLDIGGLFDEAFHQQVELDLTALTQATGRQLSADEAERYRAVQLQSYRTTFLTSGMRHPQFQRTLTALSPDGVTRVMDVATALGTASVH